MVSSKLELYARHQPLASVRQSFTCKTGSAAAGRSAPAVAYARTACAVARFGQPASCGGRARDRDRLRRAPPISARREWPPAEPQTASLPTRLNAAPDLRAANFAARYLRRPDLRASDLGNGVEPCFRGPRPARGGSAPLRLQPAWLTRRPHAATLRIRVPRHCVAGTPQFLLDQIHSRLPAENVRHPQRLLSCLRPRLTPPARNRQGC